MNQKIDAVCIVCGNVYLKNTEKTRGLIGRGVNTRTCSPECTFKHNKLRQRKIVLTEEEILRRREYMRNYLKQYRLVNGR